MRISAVIPTKNRMNDLLVAVTSVLEQERPPNELIIIDQSDSDESKTSVNSLVVESNVKLDLIYVHDQSISGLVHAKNEGAQVSSGDVVAFLEDDVVLTPNYFSELEKGFTDNPSMLGCCGVPVVVTSFTPLYRYLFSLFHQGLFYDARMVHGGQGEDHANTLVPSRFLSGGISAYRREVFTKVPFDLVNDFFMYEDIEFSTRAVREFGNDHFFINTAVRLDHRASPVNRYRLTYRWERKIRELFCFYKKTEFMMGAGFSLHGYYLECH